MTDNATATGDAEAESRATAVTARLRTLLRRFDPTLLALLGLLSLPSHVFDSLEFLEVFGIFFLFFLWGFVGPIVDKVLARGADEETEPADWIGAGSWREYAVAYLLLPTVFLNPQVITQDLLQGFGGLLAAVRYRGSLPDAASYDQRVDYRLPFDGTWTVVNGSPEREYSHSWIYPNQRYAYDFLITDEDGRSRPEGTNTAVEHYYCYDEPIVAPADGVVVDAYDAEPEASRGGGISHPLKRSLSGGYVTIKHAESEYSCLAHLRPGSVAVEPGQRVDRGQPIGRCGHTGNSSEPHLHFQIQDRPDFAMAASLPVQFDDVAIESPGVSHPPDLVPGHDVWHAGDPDESPDGSHDRTFVIRGQRVTHTDRPGADAASTAADASGTATDATGTATNADRRRDVADVTAGGTDASIVSTGRVADTLKRATLALAVGGIIAFGVGLFASQTVAAGVIAGAAVLALALHVAARLRGSRSRGRTGWLGAPLGFALAAGTVAVVGAATPLLLAAGALGYAAVAEAETHLLRDAFERPTTV